MNLRKCERPDDRTVDHGKMRHVYCLAERLSPIRSLGHAWEKSIKSRNRTNEISNFRYGIRMKGK